MASAETLPMLYIYVYRKAGDAYDLRDDCISSDLILYYCSSSIEEIIQILRIIFYDPNKTVRCIIRWLMDIIMTSTEKTHRDQIIPRILLFWWHFLVNLLRLMTDWRPVKRNKNYSTNLTLLCLFFCSIRVVSKQYFVNTMILEIPTSSTVSIWPTCLPALLINRIYICRLYQLWQVPEYASRAQWIFCRRDYCFHIIIIYE